MLAFLIAFLLYFVIIALHKQPENSKEIEKISSYECGFHPFEDTRQKFNIRFYLVSILFIIFDIEIILLFPVIGFYSNISVIGENIYLNRSEFYVILIFLIVVILGFIYEWLKGALT
jgi:NADH-quinone oxidoreductase subunit A